MSVAFHPGQTLTVNDLKIVIRDTIGNMVDPYYIRYSLFDFTTGVEVNIGGADRIPATVGVGQFYVDATIPLDSNIGDWVVRWNFKEQVGSPMVQVVQDFNVVKENVTLCITSDDHEAALIRRLRTLLRDNNPDRNYSVAGTEEVEVDAGGKKYIMSIENLWDIIEEGKNGSL